MNFEYIFSSILYILCSYMGLKLFIAVAKKIKLFDIPNERSSHVTPKPRGGGLIVWGLSLVSMALIFYESQSAYFYILATSTTLVAIIGFKDDVSGASIKIRLALHFLAALLVAGFYISLTENYLQPMILLSGFVVGFIIIFCINVYNFMDGIDGICGGFVAAVMLWMAILFYFKTDLMNFKFTTTVISILIGFLILNWAPSKLFMGDVGSGFLGVLVPSLYILSMGCHLNTIIVFLILNTAFFADSIWTLLVRILRKEKFYLAHRQHAYQHASLRLKSHSKISALYIGYTLLVAGPLALCSFMYPQWSGVFFALSYLPTIKWLVNNKAGLSS